MSRSDVSRPGDGDGERETVTRDWITQHRHQLQFTLKPTLSWGKAQLVQDTRLNNFLCFINIFSISSILRFLLNCQCKESEFWKHENFLCKYPLYYCNLFVYLWQCCALLPRTGVYCLVQFV